MPDPVGSLTSSQYEILQLLWEAESALTVFEVWGKVRERRPVGRTTVLKLVERLEKRHWLRREKVDGVYRYMAAVDRHTTEGSVASNFITDFFNGSASSFVLSLLGTKRISKSEVERLKCLLDNAGTKPVSRKSKG